MKQQLQRIRNKDFTSIDTLLFNNLLETEKLSSTYHQIKQLTNVVEKLTRANHHPSANTSGNHLSCHRCHQAFQSISHLYQSIKYVKQLYQIIKSTLQMFMETRNSVLSSLGERFSAITINYEIQQQRRLQLEQSLQGLKRQNQAIKIKNQQIENINKEWEEAKQRRRKHSQFRYIQQQNQLNNKIFKSINNQNVYTEGEYGDSITYQNQITRNSINKIKRSSKSKSRKGLGVISVENYINKAINSKLKGDRSNETHHQLIKYSSKEILYRPNLCQKLKVFSNI